MSADVQISKFLSYLLRHKPEALGLKLDKEGWANIDELLLKAKQNGRLLTKEDIFRVVKENDKQRFKLSADKTLIRASQGHSNEQVNIDFKPSVPPQILYHGTAKRFLNSINSNGILAGSRHFVHLSTDKSTALITGKRHGDPVVLEVKAYELYKAGNLFYLSDNNVWLTKAIPVGFFNCLG